MIARIMIAFVVAFLAGSPARSGSLDGIGVVLLHGKQGMPGGPIGGIAQALTAEGARVVMPEMPWSRRRLYDASYESALGEIGTAVAQLKSRGIERIVVAGQSLGANAALGYAVRRGGVAALIMLAPGHTPETRVFRERTASGVAHAKALVASGKADVAANFPDLNQGRTFDVRATPNVYLSYFDPEGPAVIPKNAAALGAVPLLWVIGTDDPLARLGRGYAFDRAQKNPKSKYLELNAGHFNTPDAARAEVVAWLKAL